MCKKLFPKKSRNFQSPFRPLPPQIPILSALAMLNKTCFSPGSIIPYSNHPFVMSSFKVCQSKNPSNSWISLSITIYIA
jgi:hypothetical protein